MTKVMGMKELLGFTIIGVLALGVIGFVMWLGPTYRVWQQEMSGRAELAEAEWSKQIMIIEAEARLEAERLNAEAEVERARGAAEAMYIVEDALTETYIRYLWVRTMIDNQNVIYVPTEAGLPLLEVGRLNNLPSAQP
ncbi:MAG: hypothetical protein LBG64_03820 [Pseudomonadales bacterium]|jgi:regulator of protease activity HflC (stomatin/prohibitin superfamily)|nr:hypothetical protein [Pseudomonadales bacterium]